MNKLYLVRHAKSSWNDSSLSDLQRPLNKRGMRNAPEMGRRLSAADVSLDLIISSPANRVLTTAKTLAKEIGYDPENIVTNNRLYFEGVSSMLKIIKNTKPDIKALMIVGHNPDMTSLVNKLCGFQTLNMPTCAIVSIHFKQGWSEVNNYPVSLVEYDYPKKST
ncbi:MAG: histidine phosphatase family protein [Gammaproteobacteria bacterium]|nr:histidine phosphatase family protein [Gammaproteobacteria bacterium]